MLEHFSADALHARIETQIEALNQKSILWQQMQESMADFLEDYYAQTGNLATELSELRGEITQLKTRNHQRLSPTSTEPNDALRHHEPDIPKPPTKPRTGTAKTSINPLKEMTTTYKKALRTYHPDRFVDPVQKMAAEETTKHLTQAFYDAHYGSLWSILLTQAMTMCQSAEEEMAILRFYYGKIHTLQDFVAMRIRQLRYSEEFQLKERAFSERMRGRDLLKETKEAMQNEIIMLHRKRAYLLHREQIILEAS